MNYKIPKWFRWGYGIVLGVIFNFILDIIFSLVYKQYQLIQPVAKYVSAVVITYIVIEILLLVNNLIRNKFNWEGKVILQYAVQFFTDFIVAVILVDLLRYLISLFINYQGYINFYDELIVIYYVGSLVILYNLIMIGINLMDAWRTNLAELERFKKENAEFRFEALRTQLNPHFLFNSLNTLSSLVSENRDNAQDFIRQLADVYRYILDTKDNDITTLQKELDFADSFISLSKLRFGENLIVKINIDESLYNKLIAPLTIQLLVENAIKHNIVSRNNPLIIEIFTDNDELIVKNNFQPKSIKEVSSKLGLRNISNRYDYISDRKIKIISSPDEFIVKIPLI